MKVDEINSYKDLQDYLIQEIRLQSEVSRMVTLELPEDWFYKLAKFIIFNLKYDKDEKHLIEPSLECDKFVVKINKIFTTVKKKSA